MMDTNEHLVTQVNKIIQTNIDRREGYEKAVDQAKEPQLKAFFEDCCKQSNENINELRQIVIQHGGSPVTDTSTAGDLYRIWMDVKSALSLSNTKAVLQSCERGEDVALSAYRDIVESGVRAESVMVHSVLKRQEDGILTMHNRVKSLRDAR
ncbi:ferritin-like domain-containing protein [Taibaiella koreensis]|uniref:ferritin-like domain-containing protein n=1 Tax=Taibaiella koreensis TaxID=1268548 RepID=UPI000E59E076|nr:PA2169 family four-helix-bundle protein [Taibaiella koreensis]